MPVQKFLRGALVLALFALSCSGSGGASWSCSMPMRVGAPPASDALVLRNFTLIDGGDHAVLSPAAMVIEAGRVAWVGPQSRLEAPDGAPVTDLNGAFVIPGLIDMHAHVGNTVDLVQDSKLHTRESIEKDLKTYASYGVTTIVSMGTDQDAIFSVRNELRSSAKPSMTRVYSAGQGLMFEG